MIRVAVSNNLRKRLMGSGNLYFYHSKGQDAQAWHWAEGSKTNLQEAGKLGVLQDWQNKLAILLETYLKRMVERSRGILLEYMSGAMLDMPKKKTITPGFQYGIVSPYLRQGHGYDPGERALVSSAKRNKRETMPSHHPLSLNYQYFSGVTKRGKVIMGSFGNTSPHAVYVEWGTGPIGKQYSSAIPRTMRERKGMPHYSTKPWTYFNYEVGHLVTTSGMPPRPFVYPAFLQLRSAFVNDCKAILRGASNPYFFSGTELKPW